MFASRPILLIKKLARPLGTWAGFSGLYALTGATCPCCGQLACPNGLAAVGLAGGLAAAGLHFWRLWEHRRRTILVRRNDSGTMKEG